MKIHALGHSAYLLEMTPPGRAEPVRILADPWLTDHAVGDLMGRFPRVRVAFDDLPEIHGLFLSHAHTDHLDPESLLLLRERLPRPPVLILPATLLFLEPLLREYLPGADPLVLEADRPADFLGLTLTGITNPAPIPSNEDDVMVLLAECGEEVFLGEADALLPLDDPDTRLALTEALLGDEVETVCWLTSRNELDATMAAVAARSREDRAARVDASLTRSAEEIEAHYAPIEGLEEDLWRDPRLVRLVGGQGICFPQEVRPDANRAIFPVRIADRVRTERELAAALGCRHHVGALVPGRTHEVRAGSVRREEIPWLALLDREEDRAFDPDAPLLDDFPVAPLRAEERDRRAQARRIGAALNDRLLPFLAGTRRPPLERLLAEHGGAYRVRVRFGDASGFAERDFLLSYRAPRFAPAEPAGYAAEAYWANDLEDFLDGRADEFSLFPRTPIGAPAQRLWSCLGIPGINADLVERKLRFHFERAARGGANRDFVLPFYAFCR